MLEHAGDNYDYNASNHGNDSPATAHANNDYNDAHGRRLLIARACRGCVPCGRLRISKAALNSTGYRSAHRMDSSDGEPVFSVVTRSGFLSGGFRALRFFFFCLANDRRDRLKRFAVAEIHQFYADCVSPNDSNFFHASPDELAFVGDQHDLVGFAHG
jgi:hypothetical protein